MARASRMAVTAGVVFVGVAQGPVPDAQHRAQPTSELHHWVLPVDQPNVEVVRLHSNDCYVVQAAVGIAHFGRLMPAMSDLQRQLGVSTSHLVERVDDHAECTRRGCLEMEKVAEALDREMLSVNQRQTRTIDHRPMPADSFYGGAYTDVGSNERERFRNAPEQRMIFQHLATARRDNCYETKMPRTLTIHVRDHEQQLQRTGVYRGYLYIEHHHPEIAGKAATE